MPNEKSQRPVLYCPSKGWMSEHSAFGRTVQDSTTSWAPPPVCLPSAYLTSSHMTRYPRPSPRRISKYWWWERPGNEGTVCVCVNIWMCIRPWSQLSRVHNNKSVQLPYGFHYHHHVGNQCGLHVRTCTSVVIIISHIGACSLVPRPFWEEETAWQLPPVQTVYGRNVTAIAYMYLIQSVKST